MEGLKKIKILAVGLVLVLILTGCKGKTVNNKSVENNIAVAQEFVDYLVEGNYSAGVSMFDQNMKKEVSVSDLSGIWDLLQQQVGPCINIIGYRTEKVEEYDVVIIQSKFEQAVIDIRVTIDQKKQIAGLLFEQAQLNKR